MNDLRIGVVGIPGKWSTEVLADALEQRTGFRRVIDMEGVELDLHFQQTLSARSIFNVYTPGFYEEKNLSQKM